MLVPDELPQNVLKNIDTLLNERTFSFSRFSLIEDCLFAYYLKYVEQVKVEDNKEYLILGKAVHKAIESKLNGLSDKESLIAGWREVDFSPLNLKEYETLFRRAKVIQGEALGESVKTEFHFKIPLSDKPNTPYLQGYIDYLRFIFGTYDFFDWKTNRSMYEADETFQLALYALALHILFDIEHVTGTLVFLRFFKNNKRRKTLTLEDMEKAKEWALSLAEDTLQRLSDLRDGSKSLQEAFPAKMHDKCSFCPFAYICVSKYPKLS